jgi:glutaminase
VFKEIKADFKNEYNWGEVADYIPSLGRANPKWFAHAFCSADG